MPITVKDLCFSYQKGTPFEKKVLHNISLTIDDGEFVGIIGPTQSGKTTLAQHFNALLMPHGGSVTVNGYLTSDPQADLVDLRLKVGYVFQNPDYQLFAQTVGEDIAFGPQNQKLNKEEIKERVAAVMAQVGLDYDTFNQRDIYALSGGQKRRAAIAGVLACKPEILILDDVTAGLDPRGREEIMTVIRDLHQKQKITIIFISNSMDEAAELAERVIVIDQGRIFLDGAVREIFKQSAQLRSIGLEIPEVISVIEMLQKRGCVLPTIPLNLAEAIDCIATAYREREENR
ncbi:MAG: energy-coupling factor transporter ATPase [Firmicutes bacterium]|nr:energy-coupling factor transporter ATPase [Bacillota bacterium]